MAADSITNFLTANSTVLAWIKTQVASATGVTDVSIVEDEPEDIIFNWLGKATRGQAVIKYESSKYNRDGGPRREMRFNVYFAWRTTTDRESAQVSAFGVMEAITAKLDHETDGTSDFICYLEDDRPVHMANSAMTVYKMTFMLEDY
jgi:hypothetical protein